MDGITSVPLIPGHEIAGEVVDVGPGASQKLLGTRCGIYFYLPCGDCPQCRQGHQNVCEGVRRLGFETDGGYAQLVVAPAYSVCPLASDVSFSQGAVATDAMLTPYHALYSVAHLAPQERVLILGAGGLGLHGVQLAVLAGARVAVCDIKAASREAALAAGAEIAVEAGELSQAMAEWTRGAGVQVILDGVGMPTLTAESFKSLARRGRLVVMGYDPAAAVPLPALGAHYNEWQVLGTRLGTKEELLSIYDLLARGRLTAAIAGERPLSEANAALAELRTGGAVGRTVLQIPR